MNSRQRIEAALNHRQPDRVGVDFGATMVTGMHVTCVYKLRQALGLDPPGTPVKVVECYEMLGEIAPDLQDALGADAVELGGTKSIFGFEHADWKPWTFHGTPVLVPGGFNTDPEPNGDILMYPEGDRSAPPSGRMPKGGYYVDSIIRQEPIDDAKLAIEDNLEEVTAVSDETLQYFAAAADHLWRETERAILATFSVVGFGDIAQLPAPWLKHPKGIRDPVEWYMSTVTRFDFVYELMRRQCEIVLANLAKYYEAVGDRIAVVMITGTDFGTQRGPVRRPGHVPQALQTVPLPHERLGPRAHAVEDVHAQLRLDPALLPDIVEAGFDVLNPVQCSAAGMDPRSLKEEFGRQIVFWGGGVDTQKTLPYGTPDEVRREVRERIEVFGRGGGYVFNTVHNIQAGTPLENILAMIDVLRELR